MYWCLRMWRPVACSLLAAVMSESIASTSHPHMRFFSDKIKLRRVKLKVRERDLSCLQGQPAATVNEPLQPVSQQSMEWLPTMNLSSNPLHPSSPTPLNPQQTKTHIKELNKMLFTDSFKMSTKTCLLPILEFIFHFSLCFLYLPTAGSLHWRCLFVFTAGKPTLCIVRGVTERTVCHEELSSTVSHCFGHWMTHWRQIRAGGIWERAHPWH